MIKENSGKIYRFKLDHDVGYGFAGVYDFTDHSMFDGRIVYIYNRHDNKDEKHYMLSEIKGTGIVLGQIRFYKFPAARGLHSWKYLFKSDELIITELPETKELHGLSFKNVNWSNFKTWYKSNRDFKKPLVYVDYEKIRHLETRIIKAPSDVVKEFTTKVFLDKREKYQNIMTYLSLAIRICLYICKYLLSFRRDKKIFKTTFIIK